MLSLLIRVMIKHMRCLPLPAACSALIRHAKDPARLLKKFHLVLVLVFSRAILTIQISLPASRK